MSAAASVVVVTLSADELRALVRGELNAALAARDRAPETPAARITLDDLARAEACSRATIRRLVAEGGPVHYLGASPRFDLAEWRTWCASRGRVGTKAAPSKTAGPVAGVRLLSRRAGR